MEQKKVKSPFRNSDGSICYHSVLMALISAKALLESLTELDLETELENLNTIKGSRALGIKIPTKPLNDEEHLMWLRSTSLMLKQQAEELSYRVAVQEIIGYSAILKETDKFFEILDKQLDLLNLKKLEKVHGKQNRNVNSEGNSSSEDESSFHQN